MSDDVAIRDASILVVDDEETNLELLETFLSEDGYTRITCTRDPRRVLELYDEIGPDLILLDLHMPHVDGFGVMARLAERIPADEFLPILVLTADITPEARQRALAGGAKDFVNKPLDEIEVLLRIRNLLRTRVLYLAQRAAREAAEAAGRRAELLAEATRVVAASLDTQTSLSMLAHLVVPALADACTVELVDESGASTRVAAAVEGPADPTAPHRPPTVLLRAPMVAGTRTLGAVTFLERGSGRRMSDDEVALASELARRAAASVENARLYHGALDAKRARDEVLAVVAHDLRNPLNTIGMAAAVLLDAAADDATRRHLEIVGRSAERMNRLIQDLLEVTRLESGKLGLVISRVPVGAILQEAVEMLEPLAAARSIRLELDVDGRLPAAPMDPARILQVISNLVGNAVKFTPEGGRIIVSCRESEGEILFAVRDTGQGIPPEQLPHIFGRFWQASDADRRGVGLGLAIARGIVEGHGGRIWAESAPGAGSTFLFAIPASSVGRTPPRSAEQTLPADPQTAPAFDR